MTQDYRKRAEEFIDFIHIRACDPNRFFMATYGEISNALETIFKQIAQEARREENEACAKVSEESIGDGSRHAFNYDDGGTTYGYDKACSEIAKAIPSRMEGK